MNLTDKLWNALPDWTEDDENNKEDFKYHEGCKKWFDGCVVYDKQDLEEMYMRDYTDEEIMKIIKEEEMDNFDWNELASRIAIDFDWTIGWDDDKVCIINDGVANIYSSAKEMCLDFKDEIEDDLKIGTICLTLEQYEKLGLKDESIRALAKEIFDNFECFTSVLENNVELEKCVEERNELGRYYTYLKDSIKTMAEVVKC